MFFFFFLKKKIFSTASELFNIFNLKFTEKFLKNNVFIIFFMVFFQKKTISGQRGLPFRRFRALFFEVENVRILPTIYVHKIGTHFFKKSWHFFRQFFTQRGHQKLFRAIKILFSRENSGF